MIMGGVAIVIESKKYEYLLPENPRNYELNFMSFSKTNQKSLLSVFREQNHSPF